MKGYRIYKVTDKRKSKEYKELKNAIVQEMNTRNRKVNKATCVKRNSMTENKEWLKEKSAIAKYSK